MVAINFLENKDNYPEVNHIDGNKKNNNITNLEWVTHKENMLHARKNKLIAITERVINHGKFIGKKYGTTNGKKRAKEVSQYSENGKLINTYKSLTKAYQNTGICISQISKCCNNKQKYAGGYIWIFTDVKKELVQSGNQN